ncbi:MAG: Mur ligase family protein [Flavobacteriaceae bacterium]|jgi:UDP-N-acetylmuramate: L-alanyl-gamma-D-glutamyl-meso-diaminopimelate ligase|nr:Mur ligase family protein [Flavobacteriaceae bacterium]MDG1042233.1 Mur ligase family protein [Flavobacteriaceae bacterium]MDG1794306.1 Mur ligase family protein [Flavobacteriaceae bacterium]
MNVHFIAIGGAAMHNLALALHNKGLHVTGSDDTIFEPSKSRLNAAGLLPTQFGWYPEKITSNLDAVVLGMHAKQDNPELLKAQELGLKIYSYPEFLYEQSKHKTRVVIGGSHGKTTITAMILHVLNYHDIDVDYMVGAQLEGFDVMVKLTDDADFIVLEGDEYLSSPIDRRPKFHLYQPNIALLSGIAWDHINVFPTFENYIEQFKIFVDSITVGGSISYNTEDINVKTIVEQSENQIRKFPYQTPEHKIEAGLTYLDTEEGPLPLEVFGAHNLNNLAGSKWICQQMGVDQDDFYEAISSFSGASKRLEKVVENTNCVVYKDFAHSPSKVKATTQAVKSQYPKRELVACLELHTYSSLNAEFLEHYKNTLDAADTAVVFYSPNAIEIKQLEAVSKTQIATAFEREDLIIFTDPTLFEAYLMALKYDHKTVLLMSSGSYGGLDFEVLKNKV